MQNFFQSFFSTSLVENTFNPPIYIRIGSILVTIFIFYICFKYVEKEWLHHTFYTLQVIQLIFLYGFYWLNHLPLSVSLPLYHCRISMFLLLFAKDCKLKKYFSLIGIFGCLCSVLVPIMDKYSWPHVTLVSYYWGHFALLGNCLIYLLKTQQQLNLSNISLTTLNINIVIAIANVLTGGSYGFLRETPFIPGWPFIARFAVVTFLLIFVCYIIQSIMNIITKHKTNIYLKI